MIIQFLMLEVFLLILWKLLLVFVVLEGILSMEIKKMGMVCPTAVHFGCRGRVDLCPAYLLPFFTAGSKTTSSLKKGVASPAGWEGRVQKRETEYQGESLVWYQVDRVQGTSKMWEQNIFWKGMAENGEVSHRR